MTINFLSYSFSGTLVKEEKGVFMEKEVHCPICKQEIAYSSRYPKYLCSTCMDLCNDAEGRPVAFYNTSISGHGCQGEYKDTEERYEGNICYVNGIPCKAQEHRFGGIVVEVV